MAARIQKFGTQAEKAPVIYVLRNGDYNHEPEKFTLNPRRYRNYDQLKQAMTDQVRLVTGAVRKVYTAEGRIVSKMEDFVDGGLYVACAAEPLKKAKPYRAIEARAAAADDEEPASPGGAGKGAAEGELSDEEDVPASPTASSPSRGRGRGRGRSSRGRGSSKSGKRIQKFGTQVEKPKIIYVFRNGDPHTPAVKITLSSKRFNNYDQLKQNMNQTVRLVTGSVRKVCTLKGRSIRTMAEFEDEGYYVACGAEPMMHIEYMVPSANDDLNDGEDFEPEEEELSDGAGPAEEPAAPAGSSRTPSGTPSRGSSAGSSNASSSSPQKYGTQADKAIFVYVFRNGDKFHEAERITVNMKRFRNFDQFKQHLTRVIKLVTGAVRKVVTLDGSLITDLDQLEDNCFYIACGAEEMKRVEYNIPA